MANSLSPAESAPMRSRLLWLALAMSAALLIASLFWLVRHQVPWWMVDFEVYRFGADAVLRGADLYRDTTPYTNLYFTYTPFAAALFVPLTLGPVTAVQFLWLAAECLFLGAAVWVVLGAVGVHDVRHRAVLAGVATAVSPVLAPVDYDLSFGQLNLMLMAVVLVDLLRGDGRRWQGIGIGIAAGVKLIPLIYIVYLALTGRLRSAGRAAGAFAATLGTGFVLLPAESLDYWFGPGSSAARPGIPQGPLNQSLRGVFARFLHTDLPLHTGWLVTAVVAGGVGLVAAAALHRAGHPTRAVLVCALTALLVSPVSWVPHWVWVVPLLVLLGALAWRSRSVWWTVVFVATALAFGLRLLFWFVPLPAFYPTSSPANLHLDAGAQLAAASYPIAAAVLIVILSGPVLRPGRRPRGWRRTGTGPPLGG